MTMLKNHQLQNKNIYFYSNNKITYVFEFDKINKFCAYVNSDNRFKIFYLDGKDINYYVNKDEYDIICQAFTNWCLKHYNKI